MKLNEATAKGIELESFREQLRDYASYIVERDAAFMRLIQKKAAARVIDVEFRVVPEVKGELTNGST